MNTYICRYCRQPSDPNSPTCPLCGAPVDIRSSVSDSGWVEQPPIKDMARLQFGQSHVQIAGTRVPVTEFNLAPDDWVYFSHHVLLWTEPQTRLTNMPMRGGWNRKMAGLPLIMVEGRGPGHIALSDNHAGEVVALPLHPGMELDVREHAFLVASHSVQYSFIRIKGLVNLLHGGNGMYIDRFVTTGYPGMLLLHGNGDVLERTLRPGEKILVEPGGLLYKDSTVQMQAAQMPLKTGMLRHGMYLAEMTGPGRVGIQSMYVHHHAD